MRIFLSYCSRDGDRAQSVAEDVRELGHEVWLDGQLSGGQAWWSELCRRIRESDAVVFALSRASVDSAPCRSELAYAEALGKPVVPVKLDRSVSPRLLPASLAEVHWVDYSDPSDRSAGFRLARSLASTEPAGPLPDPLPAPPQVPISYMVELAETIDSPSHLPLEQQQSMVFKLRKRAEEPEDHEEVRELVRRFRRREDLFALIATELDALERSLQLHPADAGARHGDDRTDERVLQHRRPPPRTEPATPPTTTTTSWNVRAIASLALALVWLYGLGSVAAILLGRAGRKEIDERGDGQRGRSLATAGIVIGWIGIVLAVLALVGA